MFFFCFFVSLQGEIGYGRTKRNADGCARLLHAGAICYPFTSLLGQVKKKKKDMFLVRISIKKKRAGWRFFFFFLLFIISYSMLSSHNITFPHGYVGPYVPCLLYFSLSSSKKADKRHLSILSFLCMRQRRTKCKVNVTPVGFCSLKRCS